MLQHATLATEGRFSVFTTVAGPLRGPATGRPATAKEVWSLVDAVRGVARLGGPDLLLFALVREHVHLVGDRSVGRVANSLSRAFRARGIPFEACRIRPVADRDHLERLVTYVVQQPSRHGLPGPASAWPGTCAWDLLGARVLPGYDPGRVAAALPDADVRALVRTALDLPAVEPGPVRREQVREWGAAVAWRVCCGAVAADPAGSADSPSHQLARRAFVRLVGAVGIHRDEARHAAGIPKSTWYDLRGAPCPPEVAEAVRTLLALAQPSCDQRPSRYSQISSSPLTSPST